MWVAHTDPTGFARLMLNLTEASRTFAPCGSHRVNRLNKKTAGFVSLISHKLAQIFTNYFFVESCWICVSFGNRSTRSTRSTRTCSTTFLPNSVRFIIIKSKISEICGICVSQAPAPRPFHQPPWDLTSSKAKISERYLCELYPHIKCGGGKKIAACGGAAIFALWVMCEFIFWGRRCFLREFWFSIGHRLASCARLPPLPQGRWQQNARC